MLLPEIYIKAQNAKRPQNITMIRKRDMKTIKEIDTRYRVCCRITSEVEKCCLK